MSEIAAWTLGEMAVGKEEALRPLSMICLLILHPNLLCPLRMNEDTPIHFNPVLTYERSSGLSQANQRVSGSFSTLQEALLHCLRNHTGPVGISGFAICHNKYFNSISVTNVMPGKFEK